MKRRLAVLLCGCLLLLTACGTAKQTETTTAATTQTTAGTTADPLQPSGKAADFSLLPEGFPPLPAQCVNLTVSNLSGTDGPTGHALHRTRVAFDCFEATFYAFTNSLQALGYQGACKNIRDPNYLEEGFHGGWQNGDHLLVIDSSAKNADGTYRFTLDFQAWENCFPKIMASLYPTFEAGARSRGDYYGYDLNRGAMTRGFSGTLDHPLWQWQFLGRDAFIGVSEEAFQDYLNALEDAGFFGDVIEGTKDGCGWYAAKIYKQSADGNLGIFMDYNRATQMLELIFSNDLNYYLGEDWETRAAQNSAQ